MVVPQVVSELAENEQKSAPESGLEGLGWPTARMQAARKLLLLDSDLYVQNYLNTRALAPFEDENFFVVASDAVHQQAVVKAHPRFHAFFQIAEKARDATYQMYSVMLKRREPRSSTFAFRFVRQREKVQEALSLERIEASAKYQKRLKWLGKLLPQSLAQTISRKLERFRLFRKLPEAQKAEIYADWFGDGPLGSFYLWAYERFTRPSRELKVILQQVKPDLVLVPTSTVAIAGVDVIRLQKELGHSYQVVFLVDNWDNLSSKAALLYQPDYMGVWGQQSLEHARDIQEYPPERVFTIGTPRYETYFEAMKVMAEGGAPPAAPYDFPYIVFAGYSWAFDELSCLRVLDDVLESVQDQLQRPVKIIYRPHPWRLKRQCPDTFYEKDYRHVILDKSLEAHYYGNLRGTAFQPDTNYLSNLLLNAEMAIGGLTSLMMEACICKLKGIVMAYDDGIHLEAPINAMKHNKHFERIDEIPSLFFVWEMAQLADTFRKVLLMDHQSIDWQRQQEMVRWYHYSDERGYTRRVHDMLDAIAQKHALPAHFVEKSVELVERVAQ